MSNVSATQKRSAQKNHTSDTNENWIIKKLKQVDWPRTIVSLLSPLYCAIIVYFSYLSIFYQLELLDFQKACMTVAGVSVVALATMLYTRKMFLTKISSLIMLPVMVLPVMLYFGQWAILSPLIVVSLAIFFLSGLGETAKTVWGTIFLLIYLLGALVYFVVNSLFAPSTTPETVATGISPSGLYRYTVTETKDSSNGSTKVSVESNTMDKYYYDLFQFKIRGLSHDVVIERPLQENITIEWDTVSRDEITEELAKISKDIEVTLSDQQMDLLGRDAYQVTFNNGQTLTMTQGDYHNTIIALGSREQEALDTDATEISLDAMGEKTKKILGITVENFKTVTLASLTEEDLTKLGIPEEGDVMYYNGKIVFRYYIAILEEYFDISKQDLSLL